MKKVPEQLWVFAGALIFFLLTLAENFSGPHDSITYLNGIVDGYPLVNQHHLLYHYTAYCWLQFFHMLLPGVKDYYIVEAFSSLWGSLSVAVIYSFFRNRFKFSAIASAAAILPIVFSYGFWFYSVNIEVYAPPLFFILMALYIISKPQLSNGDWYKIILLHILAIVFHQINILFIVVIFYKLWQQRKHISLVKWISIYAISGFILVGGAYFIVGWIVEKQNTVGKWVYWMRGYAGSDTYWHKLDGKTPINISYGFSHALLGGHYVFQLPPVKKIINSSLSNHSLSDELFIARSISQPMAVFLTILTAILFVATLWLLIKFIRNFRFIIQDAGNIIIPVLISFFTYSAFFVFWMPEILEFWILQVVLLWLVLIGTMNISKSKSIINPFPVGLTIGFLLFTINYFGSIRWMQHKEYDLYWEKAKTIEGIADKKDLVILQEGWIIGDFLHYFTKLKVEPVPSKDSTQNRIDSLLNLTLSKKQKIYILPEVNNKLRAPDTHYLDSVRNLYSTRLRKLRDKEPEVWVIE